MKTFQELDLANDLLKAISDLGYTTPTDIQEKTIPVILNSKQDIIGLAQTGTGKTAGFGLPLIQQISKQSNAVQAIILCPTRELCMQITKDLNDFSKYSNNIKITAVYGGARIDQQIRSIKNGVQIIVGTPGRTLDLIKRKVLKIDKINWLILDEADEMLNMGFRDDLDAILENTPEGKQTLLFSATMPDGVRRIAKNYMHNPVEISSGKKNTGAENVLHYYYIVKSSDRYMALKRLADLHPDIYAIVFCRTRAETKDLASSLISDGYNADALHGDLSQSQRDYVMQRFRTRQLQLLVATDVAARGLDINDLTHVLNYNLPDDPEVYLHRSGRTGRAGKNGISIIISHARESRKIMELEKMIGKSFQHKTIPTGEEICEKRLYTLIDKIENIEVDYSQIEQYLPVINKKLEWMDRNELLKRFVSVEFNRFINYYKDSKDINVAPESNKKKSRVSSGKNFSRFYINIGSKHNVKANNLMGLINERTDKKNIEIGKIDILRNFSFFEIDKNFEEVVIDAFNNTSFGSVKLAVQISKPESNKKMNNDSSNWRKRKRIRR